MNNGEAPPPFKAKRAYVGVYGAGRGLVVVGHPRLRADGQRDALGAAGEECDFRAQGVKCRMQAAGFRVLEG